MQVGRCLGTRFILPFPLVLIIRLAEVTVLHVYHIGIQVLADVYCIAKPIPQITLRHHNGRTVIASEQDAHLLFELVTAGLVVVHRLENKHAVLRQVTQVARLLFLHHRRIRILLDVREEAIVSQHLLKRGVNDRIVIVVGTRYNA